MAESLEGHINRRRLFVRVQANVPRELFVSKLTAAFPGARIGVGNDVRGQTPTQRVADITYENAALAAQGLRRNRFKLRVGNHDADITYQIERKDIVERLAGEWGCRFMCVVKNLSKDGDISCCELAELFEAAGEIFTIKILSGNRGEPYALVQFMEEQAVDVCIQQFNQAKLHGQVLYVERHLKARRSVAGGTAASSLPAAAAAPPGAPPPGAHSASQAGGDGRHRALTAAAAVAGSGHSANAHTSNGTISSHHSGRGAAAAAAAAAAAHAATGAAPHAGAPPPPPAGASAASASPTAKALASTTSAGSQHIHSHSHHTSASSHSHHTSATTTSQPTTQALPTAASMPAHATAIGAAVVSLSPATSGGGGGAGGSGGPSPPTEVTPTTNRPPPLIHKLSINTDDSSLFSSSFHAAASVLTPTPGPDGNAPSSAPAHHVGGGAGGYSAFSGIFGAASEPLANGGGAVSSSGLATSPTGSAEAPGVRGMSSSGGRGLGLGLGLGAISSTTHRPVLTPMLDLFSHLREPGSATASVPDGGPVANGHHSGAALSNGVYASSGLLRGVLGSGSGSGTGAMATGAGSGSVLSPSSNGGGGGLLSPTASAPAASGLGNGKGRTGGLSLHSSVPQSSAAAPTLPRVSIRDSLRLALGRLEELVTCPITGEVMRDPVVAADGHTYERTAIQGWLAAHAVSPVSGEPLPHRVLLPNRLAKNVLLDILPAA